MKRRVLVLAFELPPELTGGVATVVADKIRGYAAAGYRVCVIGPSSRLRLRKSDLPAAFLPIPVRGNALKTLALLMWALAAVVFMRPSFVYAMSGTYVGLVARVVRAVLGVPYLVMAYGNEFLRFRASSLLRPTIRGNYLGAEAVIAISRFTAREVRSLYDLPAAHIRIVFCGIDGNRYRPVSDARSREVRLRYGIHPETLFLLTVSRIDERKGHIQVLRAMAQLFDEGVSRSSVRYVIAGRGPYLDRVTQECTRLGLDDVVTFAGFVDDADLPALYTAADVFVMPSIHLAEKGSVEGFGLVYVEAGLCETPSIGGRGGGTSDAIADGRTGMLVDGRNVAAIAHAVHSYIRDPEMLRRHGEAARRRYAGTFTLERTLADELAIVRRLVG